ncbi:MAG: DUF2325 domain-containing protein [Spirochaetes bacterium]|nr:DUF2325 domain-containing protein [Spirochaetota bacterium]
MNIFKKNPRKKIWETQKTFHCSITGTCLSLNEIKKIFRKHDVILNRDYRDYEIHGLAVNVTSIRNEVSKSMNNFLDSKYTSVIRIFSSADNESGLIQLWEEFKEEGNIAGAYWALMTHPSVSQENLYIAFGEIHMLSHLNGSSNREHIRDIADLKKQNNILNETNKEYKARFFDLETHLRKSKENAIKAKLLSIDLDKAREEIDHLRNNNDIARLREENLRLNDNCLKSEEEIKKLTKLSINSREKINELSSEIDFLREDLASKEQEIKTIEKKVFALITGKKIFCNGCMLNEENRINLCGKCILYVGGRPSVVTRCREMVKLFGGEFIHHDGGIEENISRLPSIFKRADLVFCPLDCVSHEASLFVKKLSRQHQKTSVFMKSSGFSTFLKQMSDIADNPILIDSNTTKPENNDMNTTQ